MFRYGLTNFSLKKGFSNFSKTKKNQVKKINKLYFSQPKLHNELYTCLTYNHSKH